MAARASAIDETRRVERAGLRSSIKRAATLGKIVSKMAVTEARRLRNNFREHRRDLVVGGDCSVNRTSEGADHSVTTEETSVIHDQDRHERAVAAVSAIDLAEVRSELRFEPEDEPEITIVIPVYDKTAFTLNCLQSLQRLKTRHRFEILIMDDCSTESETGYLQDIDGVRYHRNDENLGFLRTCNRASELARGQYLVFLNNDTRVAPDWLDTMRSTFDNQDRVGIVGSKLLYPDGSLQEAGGVIWRDGSGWNYGKGNDPNHPRFNYVRDVDYVSGASLMIRSDVFAQVGGFDERFAPAYYEDTDLAFTVRQAGYRVIYQPAAEVIHYEGISSGTSLDSGVKSHQATNAVAFQRKWRMELAYHYPPGSPQPIMAADRASVGHILIIDACAPTPSKDSGSLDMVNLIRIMLNLGYRVHFANAYEELADKGAATAALQQMGVETLTAPYYSSVETYLAANEITFDHVVLTRYLIAQTYLEMTRRHCQKAQIIFNTVDLHGLREVREARLANDDQLMAQARYTEHCELAVVDGADVTIVLSETEREHLHTLGHDQTVVLPLIRVPRGRGPAPFEDRDGVVFIGGYAHPPNQDALDWLLLDIWPAVRRRCEALGLAPITLQIIGGGLPASIWKQAASDVVIYGQLENIGIVFDRSLLSVAPLRYGAGLKGKVATSMDFGLPVIGTGLAFEGMPQPEGAAPSERTGKVELGGNSVNNSVYNSAANTVNNSVYGDAECDSSALGDVVVGAETTEEFADRIVELHGDRERWNRLSLAGVAYVQQQYSVDALTDRVGRLLATDGKQSENLDRNRV